MHQLAQQIQQNTSEEVVKDTPLVAEVERLGYRITSLTEAISSLNEHLSKQPSKPESLDNIEASVKDAQSILDAAEESSFNLDKCNELQNKLVALSTIDGPPPDVSESHLPLLDIWRNVIRNAVGKYDQIVNGLSGENDQLGAAVNSWTLYIHSVDEYLNAPFPASREGLYEAARLCQVHCSILKTQQNVLNALFEQSTMEDSPAKLMELRAKLRDLIGRHKNTQVLVSEREEQLYTTIALWDNYREKTAKVQFLLLGLEQEKHSLQLRQVPRNQLNKVVKRLKTLLEQTSKIGIQIKELTYLCQQLISSCNRTIEPVLTAELNSIDQRTNNLKAALETWLKHLINIEELWKKYDAVYEKLNTNLVEHQKGLSCKIPTEFSEIKHLIEMHNNTIKDLENLNTELSKLRSIREEMVDALTPADLRLVTQRMWRLLQLQTELINQYRFHINTLDDKLELWQLYDIRCEQFMKWAKGMKERIDGSSERYIDRLIRKLEHDYQEEISMKNIDKMWLQNEGEELLKICNKSKRKGLQTKIELVETTWRDLNEKCKTKKDKLQDMIVTISRTELALADLRKWLFDIEKQLSYPVLFMTKSNKEIDRLLEVENELRKEIESQSSNISSVLNLCNMVIKDCTNYETIGETDSLQEGHSFLEQRWEAICTRSAERKSFIKKTKKLWDELFAHQNYFFSWMISMENKMNSLTTRSTELQYSNLPIVIENVYEMQAEIREYTKTYEELNHKYRILARPHGRENRLDQANEIKQMVKETNYKFHCLNYFMTKIVQRLEYSLNKWSNYEHERDAVYFWIEETEKKLDILETLDPSSEQFRKQLLDILIDYEQKLNYLESFDFIVIHLYQRSSFEDCQIIENELKEYQLKRDSIDCRFEALKQIYFKDPHHETLYLAAQEADEEQPNDDDFINSLVPDSELGTLNPAFDITLVGGIGGRTLAAELKAAIDESKKLLCSLDETITVPTPQDIEVDKMYYNFVSLKCFNL